MKRITYTVAILLSLNFLIACNNTPTNNENTSNTANADSTSGMMQEDSVEKSQEVNEDKKINDDISEFVTMTASDGMMEVELSKIAASKATSAEVKSFANQMIKDHTKANEELKSLADKKQITLPTSMSDDNKDAIEKVAKKTGKEFDQEYIDQMVEAHKKDVEAFDKASRDSKDNDIKEWAAKTLPTLRDHLGMAEKLDEKLEAKK